ncbi:MAG: hypothetical protein AB7V53_16600 [Dongiaceae bacterium]
MKITVTLPNELYRHAQSEAALRGCSLRDLVDEGLRLVLAAPRRSGRHSSLAKPTRRARGMIDSGVSDLASNPRHFAGFGRDGRAGGQGNKPR